MRKRLLSTLLALCMALSLLPATAWAAVLPPAETAYWKNLTKDASSELLSAAVSKNGAESFAFVFYGASGCQASEYYVPQFASFATESQIRAYGYANPQGSGDWPVGISELLGKNRISYPVVITYNAATRNVVSGDAVTSEVFVDLLEQNGLYELGTTDPSGYKQSGCSSVGKMTPQEIANLLLVQHPVSTATDVFVQAPTYSPYTAGTVKEDALQIAVDRLNALRRLAGLKGVAMDASLNENAQYGAVLLAAVGPSGFSHYPSKPADMAQDFFQKGSEATKSSNLAMGIPRQTMSESVDGLMIDKEGTNLQCLGHRRWQLNPAMGKVGFGYAIKGNYHCVTEKVFDNSAASLDYEFISWPASGYFPTQQLDKDTPWSVSVNPGKYSAPRQSDITVTLTRESDGNTWTFSGSGFGTAASGTYFGVDNDGYGVNNCIIFRPAGISAYSGLYTVRIAGLKDRSGKAVTDFAYQVNFFDLEDLPAHTHTWNSGEVTKEPTCTAEGVKTYTCTGCGDTKTEPIGKTSHTPGEKPVSDGGETHSDVCTVCGTKINTQEHSLDAGVEKKAATCTEKGEKVYTCTVCGYEKSEETDMIPHTFSSAQPNGDGTHSGVCTVCNEKADSEACIYNEGETIKEPTCTAKGSIKYTCTVCKYEKTVETPTVDHDFQLGEDGNLVCSVCGTTMPSALKGAYDKMVALDRTTALQREANTESAAKGYVEALAARTLPDGCTAAVTTVRFVPAAAGTAALPGGTDGSYSYVAAVTAADGSTLTTPEQVLVIQAEPYQEAATYRVSISSGRGGTVTASALNAAEGDRVVITATPSRDYELDDLYVLDGQNREVSLRSLGNGSYSFIMPDGPVYVNAHFSEIQTTPVKPGKPGNSSNPTTTTTPTTTTPATKDPSTTDPSTTNPTVTDPTTTTPAPTVTVPFHDVPAGTWYTSAVEYVYSSGIMKGDSATAFLPDASMTRSMVWMVLGRLSGADVESPEGSWYSKAQSWAVASSVSDGTNPDGSITREELVTMLWRSMGSPSVQASLAQFSDSAAVSSWASGAVQWAVSVGLLQGSDNRLNPNDTATRAEVAVILNRFCENVKK